MDRDRLDQIGERVDRIVTLDMRVRGSDSPIIEKIYPVARNLYKRPISSFAAEKLFETVKKGDFVFFATGFAAYGVAAETDGPVGAVSLGRALQIAVGAIPVFITHEKFTRMMEKTATSGGFVIVPRQEIRTYAAKIPSAAVVEGFSVDFKKAGEKAEALIRYFNPKALIAVEARGANENNEYHVVDGSNVTEMETKIVEIFKIALKQNILTIGILDGCGHEIGFGTIAEDVRDDFPRYKSCKCGCEHGMHDVTKVDIVFPAAVSNWGAHGVAACLSAISGNKNVLHDRDIESRMIRVCSEAGALDGLTGRCEYSVDGLPNSVQRAVVDILHEIIKNAEKGYTPGNLGS
jgi:D-glutamate cyclase